MNQTIHSVGNLRPLLVAAAGVVSAAALAVASPGSNRAQEPEADAPNIVFILADDLGWMDTAVYGSEYYRTPNIDRLAAQGLRFTDAYAANPLCTPTRASLVSGQYPHRLGMTIPAAHLPVNPDMEPMPEDDAAYKPVVEPNARRHLPDDVVSVGEVFRRAGYDTGYIGKWHLGHAPEHWAGNYGFETTVAGGPEALPPSYFSPYGVKNLDDGPEGEYLTERLADEAAAFIRQPRDEPFFLFYAPFAVHSPFEAKPSMVDDYAVDGDPRGKQRFPVMAAMVESLDRAVGTVLQALEERGIADETVVVFYSDNGGNEYDVDPETNIAPTDNAPLRNGKGNLHEGGVRVPLIVRWPGVTQVGKTTDYVATSVDLYPTLLGVADLPAPEGHTLDGHSLVPVLRGEDGPERAGVFCHFPHYIAATQARPASSIRSGPWKLIRHYGQGPDGSPVARLYDLEADLGETTDVSAAHPDVAARLAGHLDTHLAATGALIPVPNPRYDPAAYDAVAAPRIPRWLPSGTCTLEREEGKLIVDSYGTLPEIVLSEVDGFAGRQRVVLRMRSNSSGRARLFWNERREIIFGGRYAKWFDPVHDGQWHDYTITFEAGAPVNALQLWPSSGPGRIEINVFRYEAGEASIDLVGAARETAKE